MELQLCCLPDVFHASSLHVQDPNVLKLDTMPQVCAVLLDPSLSRTPSLTSVDLITFAGDAVDTSCFQANVILNGQRKLVAFLHGRPTVFMLCLVSTLLM